MRAADVGGDDIARVQADAIEHRGQLLRRQLLAQLGSQLLHRDRAAQGLVAVVVEGHRCAEDGEDLVADVLHHRALVVKDQLGERLVVHLEHRPHLGGLHRRRRGGETAQVAEQRSDLDALTFGRDLQTVLVHQTLGDVRRDVLREELLHAPALPALGDVPQPQPGEQRERHREQRVDEVQHHAGVGACVHPLEVREAEHQRNRHRDPPGRGEAQRRDGKREEEDPRQVLLPRGVMDVRLGEQGVERVGVDVHAGHPEVGLLGRREPVVARQLGRGADQHDGAAQPGRGDAARRHIHE